MQERTDGPRHHTEPTRRIYDLLSPHCAAAVKYHSRMRMRTPKGPRIVEETRYRCEHPLDVHSAQA